MYLEAMFSSPIWVLVGIILTIIGIFLTFKSKYSGKITFVNEQMIELFDAVGNSLDGLAVTYNGKSIEDNLVLLNGAFINTGKTDIAPEMVEQPITLKLPDGYKWLTGKLVDSNITASLEIKDNNIEISTGLFRCDECIRFQALAQIPVNSISTKLDFALSFSHRITNTKTIDSMKLGGTLTGGELIYTCLILISLIGGLSSKLISYTINNLHHTVMTTDLQHKNGTIERVKFNFIENSKVSISSLGSEFETVLTKNEFTKNKTSETSNILYGLDYSGIIITTFVLMFFSLMLWLMTNRIRDYFKNKHVLKIIFKK